MEEEIRSIVEKVILENAEMLELPIDKKNLEQIKLWGVNGVLDSLGVATVITDIEAEIDTKLNYNILISEEIFKSESNFTDLNSLVEIIFNLIMRC